jgi:hypothetical protein
MNPKTLVRYFLEKARFSVVGKLPLMEQYRGIGRGKRCFIMGGGPSLKKVDPLLLQNEDTFGVNAIYLITDWLGFLPKYYMVEDRLVVEDRGAEIAAMRGPAKFYDARYNAHIPPDMDTRNFRMFGLFDGYPAFPCFSHDAAKGIWWGGTVSYMCMQLAWYMEYDPVYLIGMDHNYVKPETTKTNDLVWTSQGDDPNHFHPDYFGKGKRWHDPQIPRMEAGFRRARLEYERAGRRIVNATRGGKLEIFPRVSFESLF